MINHFLNLLGPSPEEFYKELINRQIEPTVWRTAALQMFSLPGYPNFSFLIESNTHYLGPIAKIEL